MCMCEKKREREKDREREREREREMVIIIIALARNPPVPAFASVLVGLKNGQVWRSIAIKTIIFCQKQKRSLNVVKFDQDCHLTILFLLGSIIMETTQIAWDLVLVNFPTSNTLMMTITL